MDWLTFTSRLIEALAWPLAAVVLVILLRAEIARLAPFIKKLKAGPLEAEFEREVTELEKIPATPTQDAAPAGQAINAASEGFLFQLADLHPRSAILESWVRLEAAARAVLAAESFQTSKPAYVSAARLAEPLAQRQVLNEGQVTLFHELRRLRNEIAHAQGLEPSSQSARSYVDMATSLQRYLEGRLK